MPPKKISGKAVWAVSAAFLLVLVLLISMYLSQTPSASKESIVLPTQQEEPIEEPEVQEEAGIPNAKTDYFEVTNDNVLMALQSLSRPTAYHQAYTVTVGADAAQALQTVEIWVNGSFVHAETTSDSLARSVVSDGHTAYLWYEGDPNYISFSLENGTKIEDILGLPDFDAYLAISPEEIVDSGYLVLEDPSVQCIYVCTRTTLNDTCRHWVNLENGLLYQSDVLESSNQVYTIRQTLFETLAVEDESFHDRFLLPDGTAPFIAAREMPQP